MTLSPHTRACEEAIALLTQRKAQLQIQHVESEERLRELWEIDKAAYQDCSLEFDEFAEWWRQYELGSKILLSEGRIVASVGIYPLRKEQALAFANGEICEADLVPVSFDECEHTPQQYWYASGIVVAEDLRGWGSPLKPLLQLGISYWLNSGHVAYPLNLMAIAEYEIGARLLSCFGLSRVQDGTNLPDKCDLYQASFQGDSQVRSIMRSKRL